MRVVQLLPALEAGGVEQSTLEIAAALTAAGHRARVVSAGGGLLPRLLASGAEHIALDIGRKSPLTLRHLPVLRRLFAEADIVHARSRLPAWLAWLALRGMPRPPRFVTTAHGLNSPGRYSAIMTRGDRVVCVSKTVREHLLKHYPRLDPARLRVIPRGIDPARFVSTRKPTDARRALSERFPSLSSGRLLLLPGRGTRLKGHADALELLAALRARGRDARLLLAGVEQPGRERYLGELHAHARALGVSDCLATSPPRADMPDLYAACDLVLQLSNKPESFGRTVLEALAAGRPILGWGHGGVGELLNELYPDGAAVPFRFESLLGAAEHLLDCPPSPPAIIPYTLAAMQTATLDLYEQLLHA